MKSGEPIRIDELPIEGLHNLQQQLHQVMEAKRKGVEILQNTAAAFDQSRSAVQDLSKLNEGKFIQLQVLPASLLRGGSCVYSQPVSTLIGQILIPF
jgi:hypothetical protein